MHGRYVLLRRNDGRARKYELSSMSQDKPLPPLIKHANVLYVLVVGGSYNTDEGNFSMYREATPEKVDMRFLGTTTL